jgi:hypothetical protein
MDISRMRIKKSRVAKMAISSYIFHGVFKNVPVRLLGTRFKARNCISEPGLQEHDRENFWDNFLD